MARGKRIPTKAPSLTYPTPHEKKNKNRKDELDSITNDSDEVEKASLKFSATDKQMEREGKKAR